MSHHRSLAGALGLGERMKHRAMRKYQLWAYFSLSLIFDPVFERPARRLLCSRGGKSGWEVPSSLKGVSTRTIPQAMREAEIIGGKTRGWK